MEVYFNSSFLKLHRDSGNGGPSRCRRTVHAGFMEGGLKRAVPAIYCFSQGIVFDILTVCEKEAMQKYFEMYDSQINHAEAMSDPQLDKLFQKNPYQGVEIAKLWLNGQPAGQRISSGSIGQVPGRDMGPDEKETIRQLKEAYPEYLEEAECFFCERFCAEWDIDYTEEHLISMKIQTRKLHQAEPFMLEAEVHPGEEKQLSFTHPVTGVQHQIYIYEVENTSVPAMDAELGVFTGTAEIIPKLPEGERLLFDSSLSCERSREDGCKGAAAVSIIGGMSGPTAIFLAGKEKKEVPRYGGERIPCFSKPYWSTEEAASVFIIEGLERTVRDEEVVQVFGENSEAGGRHEDFSSD